MKSSERPKLTMLERMLVIFTFISLAFWIDTFCMAVICFGITVIGPLLCLWAVVAFSMRALSYIRTRDVECIRGKAKKHFILSLLSAIFWCVFAVMIWIAFGENVYYGFHVKSFSEFLEVLPYSMIFITPTVTTIYFTLMAVLRWKNRVEI